MSDEKKGVLYARGVKVEYIQKLRQLIYHDGHKHLGSVLNEVFKDYLSGKDKKEKVG